MCHVCLYVDACVQICVRANPHMYIRVCIWVLSKIRCSRKGHLREEKQLSRNFRGTIVVHVSDNSSFSERKERERGRDRLTDSKSERVAESERE